MQAIIDLIKSKTNIEEVTTDNVLLGLSACGWNMSIYKGNSIYVNKVKIELSETDIEFLRAGLPSWNANRHRFSEELSF